MAEETAAGAQAAAPAMGADQRRLHELGYAQELRRHMSGFTNFVAYVTPTLLRLRQGSGFKPGPWQLGRWSRPVGTVAVVWVAFITVLFMLPAVAPITAKDFNYTPIAVLVVLGFAGIWWLVSARRWFTGPRVQGSPEELAAIEDELESLALCGFPT